jgi:hypothetical protein
LKDRFGTLPQELEALLQLTCLRMLCGESRIAAVHAGPAAVALTPHDDGMESLLRLPGAHQSKDRVILPIVEASPAIRLRRLLAVFDQVTSFDRHVPSVRPEAKSLRLQRRRKRQSDNRDSVIRLIDRRVKGDLP